VESVLETFVHINCNILVEWQQYYNASISIKFKMIFGGCMKIVRKELAMVALS
jgi:hypothetical protein